MSRGQFITLTLLLTVAVVAGAVAGSMLSPIKGVSAQELKLVPASIQSSAIATPSFSDLAEQAIPSVVQVVNDRKAGTDPHAGLGMRDLRRFRGNPFGQDGEEPREGPAPERRIPEGMRPQSSGTGFFISKEGFLITNKHVVENADRLRVRMHDAKVYDARLVGIDPELDLALLKVDREEDFAALPLGSSDSLRVAEWVMVIGNPIYFRSSVTVGVVSGKGRELRGDPGLSGYIQTDAAINFGNSGGPLINTRGEVVGIATAIIRDARRTPFSNSTAEGLGFALPISWVKRVLDQLAETGTVRRGFLGVTIEDVSEDAAEWAGLEGGGGAFVSDVAEDKPAAAAGVLAGDIILEVNGQSIGDRKALVRAISDLMPDETVRLIISRAGERLTIDVTLTERLAENVRPQRIAPVEPEEEIEVRSLGFTVRPVPQSMKDAGFEGVLVFEVDPQASAWEKGLRAGWILVDVNGTPTPGIAEYSAAIGLISPGQVVRIRITNSSGEQTMLFFRAPADGSAQEK